MPTSQACPTKRTSCPTPHSRRFAMDPLRVPYEKPLVTKAGDAEGTSDGDGRRSPVLVVPAAGRGLSARGCRASRGAALRSTTSSWRRWKPSSLCPEGRRSPQADPPRDFDLTGLPPTPDGDRGLRRGRVARRLRKAGRPAARQPAYGERWARHWLDVARFAESHGFEQDYDRPYAYHYRDFVIRALNDDMPYDQFVRWQLAGDELEPDNPLAMMATGFLGAGIARRRRSRPTRSSGRATTNWTTWRRRPARRMLGPDGRLRPLPRPQVRPDPAGRLLPAAFDVHDDGAQRDGNRPAPRALLAKRRPSSTPSTAVGRGAGRVREGATAGQAAAVVDASAGQVDPKQIVPMSEASQAAGKMRSAAAALYSIGRNGVALGEPADKSATAWQNGALKMVRAARSRVANAPRRGQTHATGAPSRNWPR